MCVSNQSIIHLHSMLCSISQVSSKNKTDICRVYAGYLLTLEFNGNRISRTDKNKLKNTNFQLLTWTVVTE